MSRKILVASLCAACCFADPAGPVFQTQNNGIVTAKLCEDRVSLPVALCLTGAEKASVSQLGECQNLKRSLGDLAEHKAVRSFFEEVEEAYRVYHSSDKREKDMLRDLHKDLRELTQSINDFSAGGVISVEDKGHTLPGIAGREPKSLIKVCADPIKQSSMPNIEVFSGNDSVFRGELVDDWRLQIKNIANLLKDYPHENIETALPGSLLLYLSQRKGVSSEFLSRVQNRLSSNYKPMGMAVSVANGVVEYANNIINVWLTGSPDGSKVTVGALTFYATVLQTVWSIMQIAGIDLGYVGYWSQESYAMLLALSIIGGPLLGEKVHDSTAKTVAVHVLAQGLLLLAKPDLNSLLQHIFMSEDMMQTNRFFGFTMLETAAAQNPLAAMVRGRAY